MAFYNLVITNIEDLIKYKLELKEIYVSIDRTKYKKHINQITFKTNNYRKWFSQLEKIDLQTLRHILNYQNQIHAQFYKDF